MLTVQIINKSPYDLPEYKTTGSAGMDLRAHIEQPIELASLDRMLIPTGLHIALPLGYEAQIRPRSGTAYKKGLSVPNAPGTIDSDYRGEVKVLIINLSRDIVTIDPGERIAQMVVAKHEQVEWLPTERLEDTVRGEGGFGSTGS